jgi:hypothetical protein
MDTIPVAPTVLVRHPELLDRATGKRLERR